MRSICSGETMRDFPNDEVCRDILARLLISTGRRAEAEDLLREAIRNFPKNEVFRNMLDELSSTTERHEDRGAETDAATKGRLAAPGQAEEQEIEGDSGGMDSAIRAYLGRLTNQVSLLEAYFAPSAGASDAGALPGTPNLETGPSLGARTGGGAQSRTDERRRARIPRDLGKDAPLVLQRTVAARLAGTGRQRTGQRSHVRNLRGTFRKIATGTSGCATDSPPGKNATNSSAGGHERRRWQRQDFLVGALERDLPGLADGRGKQ